MQLSFYWTSGTREIKESLKSEMKLKSFVCHRCTPRVPGKTLVFRSRTAGRENLCWDPLNVKLEGRWDGWTCLAFLRRLWWRIFQSEQHDLTTVTKEVNCHLVCGRDRDRKKKKRKFSNTKYKTFMHWHYSGSSCYIKHIYDVDFYIYVYAEFLLSLN